MLHGNSDCMCLVQTTVFILGKNIKKNETIIIFFLAVNGRERFEDVFVVMVFELWLH